MGKKILIVCTTDSMISNFLVPHIKDLEEKGHTVECACSETGNFFCDLKEKHGIKIHKINFERSPYNTKNFSAYKSLLNLVNENKYDVIFCHEPIGGVMGRLVGKKCGCAVIYMAHGFHFYKGAPLINKLLYYTVEWFLSRYTDALITINEEDYEASKKLKAKSVYKINGIGVDTRKFFQIERCNKLKDELGIDEDCLMLLSVGELSDRKNHKVIIKALHKLRDTHFHYVIVGEGVLLKKLKKLVKKYNLSSQVHLLGYRTDIQELCSSSDIFVFPSYQEGLSVALMEAMGCAKPIIASNIRGNIDLIEENKGGFLCAPDDASGFAEAINKVAADEKIRNDMGEYNRENVKKFDISIVKEEMEKIYSEVFN